MARECKRCGAHPYQLYTIASRGQGYMKIRPTRARSKTELCLACAQKRVDEIIEKRLATLRAYRQSLEFHR